MKKFFLALSISLFAGLSILPSQAAPDYTSLFQPVVRGDQSTESVYFVMTDRFANGDTSNDQGGLTGSSSITGFDPTDIGYWHGGDLKGLTSHLDYIQAMGFTSIWITPPVVQQYVQGSSAAYHGYWALDFMNIDPHLGTSEDFSNFVSAAHSKGMKVIVDVVANHTADVIQYSGSKAFIPAGREKAKNPAFLNNLTNYHNAGPSTFEGESALTGDFYSLDDLATEKPAVVQGFIGIWSYWIKNYDIDGFRIDTFRHVNPEFWKQVIPAIQRVAKAQGKKSFPIFGEVYDSNPEILSSYIVSGQAPSLLDFAFNEQVTKFIATFGQADRLSKLFNQDDLYTTANSSAYGLATFLGNHDMGRIGTAIAKNAFDGQQALKEALTAQAALFLLRGGPVVYYGDEHGLAGGGGDKYARQDLFPTKVEDWALESRIGEDPIGSKSSFDVANPIMAEISKLSAIVAANPALRNGTQQTLFAKGRVFAAARYANQQEYVVVLNAADTDQNIAIAPMMKGSSWSALAGSCTAAPGLKVAIPATSYCLLKSDSKLSASSTTSISAPKVSTTNDSGIWKQVSAKVNAPGYNEVTFLAREKGGKWRVLGTSDRTTFSTDITTGGLYRVYLHPTDFKKKSTLDLIAVARNSDGKKFASAITKVVNN